MALADRSQAALVELVQEVQAALATALARIAELEQALGTVRSAPPAATPPRRLKTPENSSVPPAKGWKRARPAAAAPGAPPAKRGPKPGHRGVSRSRIASSAVDVVLPCRPTQCASCGHDLPTQGGKVVGRKQVVEVPPIRPLVDEAQRWRVHCRHGQHTTVGAYPRGYGATGRFGPRLLASVAYLHEEQHIAYARVGTVLQELFGLQLSEGALVAAVGRLGNALIPVADGIGEEVRRAAFIGSDETSVRVDGQTWWEWVFQTEAAAYHTLARRRNTAVVLTFLRGVIPKGWGSDLWNPQLAAARVAAVYQICLAHQLRELRDAEQVETAAGRQMGLPWAVTMAALLREAIHTRNEHTAGRLDAAAAAAAVASIEQRCDALLAEPLPTGCSRDLQVRFVTHRRGLLTFLHHHEAPPTNNASERSLRPSVVQRKVTGGFRDEAWATAYAALRTVTDTARKRGQAIFAT
ncbi:MAG: IS66 family transposase [Mycobacterium sp.]